jgi:hypothetical protein
MRLGRHCLDHPRGRCDPDAFGIVAGLAQNPVVVPGTVPEPAASEIEGKARDEEHVDLVDRDDRP